MTLAFKIALPILFLLVAIGVFSCTFLRGAPPPPKTATEPPAIPITVLSIEREPVHFTVSSQGTVTPRIRTTIVSEVTGNIVEVAPSMESGGFFASQDVLVRVDPRNYETAVRRAQADLARARTNVQTENAMASHALSDLEKAQNLIELSDTPSDLTLRKPQLAAALAEMDHAKATLQKAEEDLERTVIRAPFEGMVLQKHSDLGQFVNTGSQLATIVSIDMAEVRLPLTIRDFHYLDIEHLSNDNAIPVSLTAETGPGVFSTWEGQIVRSEGTINETSRVIYVVAQVKRPYEPRPPNEELMLFGTFVTAEITGRAAGNLFLVPRDLVQSDNVVWVVEDDKLYPRAVDVVRADSKFAYVSGGLAESDKICQTSIDQLVPGMRVEVRG